LKEFVRRICFAELDAHRPLALDGVATAVQLSLLCLAWKHGELSAATVLAAAGAGHAAAIAVWLTLFRPAFALPPRVFRHALRLNWGLGSWTCLGRATEMLHAYSLHWLLAVVSGPAATGAYAAAMSLLALSNPVLMGIGNLLAPETAHAYAAGGRRQLREVAIRASCQVTLVTAVFVIVLVAGAEPLLQLTFGQAEAGQAAVVRILAVAMLAGITGFGADNGLRALARPIENLKAGLLGSVAALAVAAAVVGPWGAVGAALGALAGNGAAAMARIGMFLRLVRVRETLTQAVAGEAH
jgi:O-antigen/teichoic acid export membrane protein